MDVDNATAGDELSEFGITGNEACTTRAGRVVWDNEAKNHEMMVRVRGREEHEANRYGSLGRG